MVELLKIKALSYIFINKKYIYKKCLQFSSSENIAELYEKLRK